MSLSFSWWSCNLLKPKQHHCNYTTHDHHQSSSKYIHFVLLPYTPAGSALLGENYHSLPMLGSRDFNKNFNGSEAQPLLEFLKDQFGLQINSNRTQHTTQHGTTIDVVFQRGLIWISIDETTDVEGRYIANVIIGTLEINEPGQIFLLASEILEKANHQGICKLFEDSLLLLWPDKICRENVLLFVTDAAPYMVKAVKVLQSLFTKMIHITCVAHGLHRISEEVRKHFSKVDSLISNGKKVFLKAPSRINAFQTIAPEISLPPQPIITRWGTWLDAAAYYCDHFDTFFRVMQTFDKNDASSVNITKSLMEDPTIKNDLIFIKTHFGFLVDKITSLEKQGVLLTDSILIVEEVKAKIFQVPGNVGKSIQTKLDSVYDKNHGLKKLNTISNILAGKNHVTIQDLEEELTTSDLPCFKYAPVSSTDVERSFSKFKMLLSDNRRKFTFDNLKKTLIIQCNSQLLD
ncbi:uncharacterized protein LOC132936219 [Metopolophium dirhodum]|uniref:uncharacterized protein LOC132936219 n=1 Tax=Metopolophium dirhodum TaxID=44670 RepID=UPI0029901EDC|nr:uncharacterized protein LOC132936219 [Metopolophium dirhodum]